MTHQLTIQPGQRPIGLRDIQRLRRYALDFVRHEFGTKNPGPLSDFDRERYNHEFARYMASRIPDIPQPEASLIFRQELGPKPYPQVIYRGPDGISPVLVILNAEDARP